MTDVNALLLCDAFQRYQLGAYSEERVGGKGRKDLVEEGVVLEEESAAMTIWRGFHFFSAPSPSSAAVRTKCKIC